MGDSFSARAKRLIAAIPAGRVATYGQIAACAGNHRGARQVAWLLHSSSRKDNLPWHRVVNQKRTISPRSSGSHLIQQQMLEDEGIDFDLHGKIDFTRDLWLPIPGERT